MHKEACYSHTNSLHCAPFHSKQRVWESESGCVLPSFLWAELKRENIIYITMPSNLMDFSPSLPLPLSSLFPLASVLTGKTNVAFSHPWKCKSACVCKRRKNWWGWRGHTTQVYFHLKGYSCSKRVLNSIVKGHILCMLEDMSNTHTVHWLHLNSVCLQEKILILLQGDVDKSLISQSLKGSDEKTVFSILLSIVQQCHSFHAEHGYKPSVL